MRINQALYFWFDFESQAAFGVAKYATLEPLGLFAWVVAWSEWTQSKNRKRIQQTALALAAMTVMAVVVELEWLRTATRLASGMLLILAACIGWRARRPDRLLAAACIALIAIGQFAEELWRIGVPGIWFPFGTGVSRTQFAYAAFVVAMTAFLMRCLTRADAWSLSCRSQLQR